MTADSDPQLNPRLTPARADLAAAHLRGRVAAKRFTDGRCAEVVWDVADVKRLPRPDAPLDTQLLRGETVVVYDDDEGWCWVQAERDGYVGYVPGAALAEPADAPTHRVAVNRTFLYPAPDMKRPVTAALPREARVMVEDRTGAFARIAGGGYVHAAHLAPLGAVAPDFVAVAEAFVGAPYLWGGRTVGGIDCSGLVQLAAAAAGLALPRDTDMQERVGSAVEDRSALRRGDLVFWRGHVGIMRDAETLLHANAHHMLVMPEPLHAAQTRIRGTTGGDISSMRRIDDANP